MVRHIAIAIIAAAALCAQPQIPHLRKQGTATQLIVDGKPFLILGGELHNSSSSNIDYMNPIWKRMTGMHFNTVLAGVSWELIEPDQGRFDFRLVDGLIDGARRHNLRLVFLWFGSWKNGMSSYIPAWVKKDYKRFGRVQHTGGKTVEVLSTLVAANQEADAKAFAALMRHIREVDSRDQTVIMVQVENEVGILGDSRDRSAPANAAFAQPVPQKLLDALARNRESLYPDLRARFRQSSGAWEQAFGTGPETDEIFMAWNYANYVNKVAAAGKAEYPIPLYTNTLLSSPDKKPGFWPSGGPLPHVMDVWQAAGNDLDILSPDIYQPNFAEWCRRYVHRGNPLFIPEMMRDAGGAKNVFYAIGRHDAIGTAPFAVDSIPEWETAPLGKSYAILEQLAPLILEHQGKGEVTGFVLDKEHPSVKAEMGGYELDIRIDSIFGFNATAGHGLIIATGPGEFVGAGTGYMVAFTPKTPGPKLGGIVSVDEGEFRAGKWVAGRRLNGDENDQGQHWRFSPQALSIERCVVYRYE